MKCELLVQKVHQMSTHFYPGFEYADYFSWPPRGFGYSMCFVIIKSKLYWYSAVERKQYHVGKLDCALKQVLKTNESKQRNRKCNSINYMGRFVKRSDSLLLIRKFRAHRFFGKQRLWPKNPKALSTINACCEDGNKNTWPPLVTSNSQRWESVE